MSSPRTVEDPTRRYYVRTPDGAIVGPYTQRGAETVKNRRNLGAGPLSRCEVVRQSAAESARSAVESSRATAPAQTTGESSRRRGQAAPTNGSVPADPGGATAATSPDGLCLCGCGEKVTREFRPGHDARYKGELVRKAIAGDAEAEATIERRGWRKFLDKGRNAASNRAEREARREQSAADRGPRSKGYDSNGELIETMKAARLVLLELGRYGRAAGERRIDITAENAKAIADRTFDFDSYQGDGRPPPIYGEPGYEGGVAEVTRHIEPLPESKAAKARKQAAAKEKAASTRALEELLP